MVPSLLELHTGLELTAVTVQTANATLFTGRLRYWKHNLPSSCSFLGAQLTAGAERSWYVPFIEVNKYMQLELGRDS